MSPQPSDDGYRPWRPDMSREQECEYWQRLREMDPSSKLAEVSRLTELEWTRIEQRIRALRPTVSEDDLKMHRAAILYGRDLLLEGFGWDPLRKGW